MNVDEGGVSELWEWGITFYLTVKQVLFHNRRKDKKKESIQNLKKFVETFSAAIFMLRHNDKKGKKMFV